MFQTPTRMLCRTHSHTLLHATPALYNLLTAPVDKAPGTSPHMGRYQLQSFDARSHWDSVPLLAWHEEGCSGAMQASGSLREALCSS